MKKVLYLVFLLCFLSACKQSESSVSGLAEPQASAQVAVNNNAVTEAFNDKKSNLFIEGSGTVKKLLPDDNKGSRHQKFLVIATPEQTLLFAHNIDLAQPIPLAVGDTIQFRGEYVYNPKGGVMHWTHRDPQSKSAGGWIKHNGKTYN